MRKSFDTEFMAKVALEAIREEKTIAGGVSPISANLFLTFFSPVCRQTGRSQISNKE